MMLRPSPHNRSRDVKAGALQEIRRWRLNAGENCCLQLQVAWPVTAQLLLKIRHKRPTSDNTKFWKIFLFTWVNNSFCAYPVQSNCLKARKLYKKLAPMLEIIGKSWPLHLIQKMTARAASASAGIFTDGTDPHFFFRRGGSTKVTRLYFQNWFAKMTR